MTVFVCRRLVILLRHLQRIQTRSLSATNVKTDHLSDVCAQRFSGLLCSRDDFSQFESRQAGCSTVFRHRRYVYYTSMTVLQTLTSSPQNYCTFSCIVGSRWLSYAVYRTLRRASLVCRTPTLSLVLPLVAFDGTGTATYSHLQRTSVGCLDYRYADVLMPECLLVCLRFVCVWRRPDVVDSSGSCLHRLFDNASLRIRADDLRLSCRYRLRRFWRWPGFF